MSAHSDSVKERIINVGCQLWALDPMRVSVREIARLMECSHANILYHFGSVALLKAAIAEHAVQTGNAEVIAHLIVNNHEAAKSLPAATRERYIRKAGKF